MAITKDKCDNCKTEISIFNHRLNKFKHHFCSKRCYGLFNRGKQRPELRGHRELVEFICSNCNKAFNRVGYEARRSKMLYKIYFCNRDCHGKYKSKQKDLSVFREMIINMYNQGFSAGHIAGKLHFSQSHILNNLSFWNIPKRIPQGYGSRLPNGCFKSDDGHSVRSSPELIIDNFLYHNDISHSVGGKILDTNYEYDFYLTNYNLYIEYFGCLKSKNYRETMKKKIKIYNDNHLRLLIILPNHDIKKRIKEAIVILKENEKPKIKF